MSALALLPVVAASLEDRTTIESSQDPYILNEHFPWCVRQPTRKCQAITPTEGPDVAKIGRPCSSRTQEVLRGGRSILGVGEVSNMAPVIRQAVCATHIAMYKPQRKNIHRQVNVSTGHCAEYQ